MLTGLATAPPSNDLRSTMIALTATLFLHGGLVFYASQARTTPPPLSATPAPIPVSMNFAPPIPITCGQVIRLGLPGRPLTPHDHSNPDPACSVCRHLGRPTPTTL